MFSVLISLFRVKNAGEHSIIPTSDVLTTFSQGILSSYYSDGWISCLLYHTVERIFNITNLDTKSHPIDCQTT